MISNEQGRCGSHVTLVGIRSMFGVPGPTVRITISSLYYLFCISISSSAYLSLLLKNNCCTLLSLSSVSRTS